MPTDNADCTRTIGNLMRSEIVLTADHVEVLNQWARCALYLN
jgi:hypothetical protein